MFTTVVEHEAGILKNAPVPSKPGRQVLTMTSPYRADFCIMDNRVVEFRAAGKKFEERKEARKMREGGKISFSDETLPELQRIFELGKSRGLFTRAELSHDDDSVEYRIYDSTQRPLFAIQKLLYEGRGFYCLRYKGKSIYHDEYIPPLLMALRQQANKIDAIVNKPPLGMRRFVPRFDFSKGRPPAASKNHAVFQERAPRGRHADVITD